MFYFVDATNASPQNHHQSPHPAFYAHNREFYAHNRAVYAHNLAFYAHNYDDDVYALPHLRIRPYVALYVYVCADVHAHVWHHDDDDVRARHVPA